ncbi:4-hydroxythreonine-4-phosphate dehydrogenase PdxA [Nisaea sp.]|uniref:4-hydroxythreonine-4-phosphate dehydrogenase PdxA n=1 Tax=Nisaea sp. TaxID=2024842 RepID=UPI003B52712A
MPTSETPSQKPTIALALGDAAGIGGELAVKILSDKEVLESARLIVIGDRRQLEAAAAMLGTEFDLPDCEPETVAPVALLDLGNIDPASVTPGEASEHTGAAALENFAAALRLCAADGADAVAFTPFNKYAMRLARPDYVDEIGFINAVTGATKDGREFNVLDEFWNARVTSHIPLSQVAERITEERVLASIELTDNTMRNAGFTRPRIAVAALNPHAGDGGNFGHEDDREIAPAVTRAKEKQISVEGPLPSDTVYLRAHKGEFDAVLSMYHDQGQIAMKLIGFDRGVTLIGGYPFWIATPAHGTAYDIAGQGIANPNATKRALLLAARLARQGELVPADATSMSSAIAKATGEKLTVVP